LVEETRELLGRYGESAYPLASIGYRQVLQLLRNEGTPDEALRAVQQAHRNYAKRQMTWFRREANVSWIAGFGDQPETQQEALMLIRSSL